MYNTFILSYDPEITDPTPKRIIEFIRSNGYTYQYMLLFGGTIFIKSTSSLIQMTSSYTPFFEPNNFILAQVAPSFVNGLLPSAYWDWINAAAPPPLLESN